MGNAAVTLTDRQILQEHAVFEAWCATQAGKPTPWQAWMAAKEAEAAPCPYVVTSRGGTSHCRLAEADARDAARLDWLESRANEPGGLLLHDGSEQGRVGIGLRPGMLDRTLREAIDAAMGGKP